LNGSVKRHLPTAQVYQTTGQIEDTFGYYRKVAQDEGWEATPDDFILCRHIYVDESDKKAQAGPASRRCAIFSLSLIAASTKR
jgi:hypothetical protein